MHYDSLAKVFNQLIEQSKSPMLLVFHVNMTQLIVLSLLHGMHIYCDNTFECVNLKWPYQPTLGEGETEHCQV